MRRKKQTRSLKSDYEELNNVVNAGKGDTGRNLIVVEGNPTTQFVPSGLEVVEQWERANY
nr:6381_t:CDS:2 [Entrophospora candida]